jgi:hypothetical protein
MTKNMASPRVFSWVLRNCRFAKNKLGPRWYRSRKTAGSGKAAADFLVAGYVREILKDYTVPSLEDPWKASDIEPVWEALSERISSSLGWSDEELSGAHPEKYTALKGMHKYVRHLIWLLNEAARRRYKGIATPADKDYFIATGTGELQEYIEIQLGVDMSAPPPPSDVPHEEGRKRDQELVEKWRRKNAPDVEA